MLRKHKLLAVKTDDFSISGEDTINEDAEMNKNLRLFIQSAGVIKVSPRRLSTDRVRVRLDLAGTVSSTFGSVDYDSVKLLSDDSSKIGEICKTICEVMS